MVGSISLDLFSLCFFFVFFIFFKTDSTMADHHQTTIWENMSYFFQASNKQKSKSVWWYGIYHLISWLGPSWHVKLHWIVLFFPIGSMYDIYIYIYLHLPSYSQRGREPSSVLHVSLSANEVVTVDQLKKEMTYTLQLRCLLGIQKCFHHARIPHVNPSFLFRCENTFR